MCNSPQRTRSSQRKSHSKILDNNKKINRWHNTFSFLGKKKTCAKRKTNFFVYPPQALSKNQVIYHRGERRVRRVLRLFQSLLRLSGASAFSVCSAVKFKDLAISLKNSAVPICYSNTARFTILKCVSVA